MMIGEFHRPHPTIQIPTQWDPYEDPTAEINSPYPVYTNSPKNTGLLGSPDRNPFTLPDSLGSLQRYLPSNEPDTFDDETFDSFACDNFRMYDFKVRRCAKARSHDWTECPFAHPGEKARRRDPRKHSYSGTPCPEFRKSSCPRGDSCEFAHGVFECWLHPDRYRTQACKDGLSCRRRICFFAHSPDQLRGLNLQASRVISYPPDSYDGSPLRRSFDSYMCNNNNHNTSPSDSSLGTFYNTSSFGSSSPPASSPSPPPFLSSSYNELVSSMRSLQLAKAMLSPRVSNLRPGFCSLPATPTRAPARPPQFEEYEVEEPVMERVESGRDLRTKLYARLSKENSFGPVNNCPDVGWISDLVQ